MPDKNFLVTGAPSEDNLATVLNYYTNEGWEVYQVTSRQGYHTVIFRNPQMKVVNPDADSHSAFDEEKKSEREEWTVAGLSSGDRVDVERSFRDRGWELASVETSNDNSKRTTYDLTFRKF